eukprot:TRINITY_DN28782_c0_g1_i1.p1 TRINITY_DN28782_c0_g1~~TRINITY_DN28782_c0_g1_i1.p1  ORF type:complete len:197 (+),score=8.10 TRINITY_DN28782_c0_g1_i1:65-655(+)
MTLKSFSATHFQYQAGDTLGKMCCLVSLLPYIIGVMLATWFLGFRNVETVVLGMGVIINDLINIILKNTIKEERPSGTGLDDVSYGMPSRHAQFTTFACVFLMLKTPLRKKTALLHLFLLSTSLFMAFARVYLQYHTIFQVVVGCLVGVIFALFWYPLSKYLSRSRILIKLTKLASEMLDIVIGTQWEPSAESKQN